MRILIATDAWHPQVNGVVRTLTMMADAARKLGADVSFLTPQSFRTFALPSYPDLRVALPNPLQVARLIREAKPDNIHIATEGADRILGSALLPQARHSLHHQLSHPLSGIRLGTVSDPEIMGAGGIAPVPRPQRRGDGGDAGAGR